MTSRMLDLGEVEQFTVEWEDRGWAEFVLQVEKNPSMSGGDILTLCEQERDGSAGAPVTGARAELLGASVSPLKTERAGKPHAFRVDLAQGAGKFKLHCVAGKQRFGGRVWGAESPREENRQLMMRLQRGAEERCESGMALSARGSGSG